jgi:hypothetical protein
MAELVVLSVSREKIADAARRRDNQVFRDLWAEYRGRELECFLCGGLVDTDPIHSLLLRDKKNFARGLVVPLCRACVALPKMTRLARETRMLKRMGWGVHFSGRFGSDA